MSLTEEPSLSELVTLEKHIMYVSDYRGYWFVVFEHKLCKLYDRMGIVYLRSLEITKKTGKENE